MADSLILGIDGGGTKTIARLARCCEPDSWEVLGIAHSGSSNIKAVGKLQAIENLAAAVQDAWQQAGVASKPVEMAVFGLSGAGRPETQQFFTEWATTSEIAKRCRVVHDAYPVLAAADGHVVGIALISGTGSVAYGVDGRGRKHIAGGWGYWFGDEGSAYSIGREALVRAARMADGRLARSQLMDQLLRELGLNEPRDILSSLEQRGDVRSAIAGLAPLVCRAADADEVAAEVLASAADHLASLVTATASELSLPEGFTLALAGGVLCNADTLRTKIVTRLEKSRPRYGKVCKITNPVEGCLRLAARWR